MHIYRDRYLYIYASTCPSIHPEKPLNISRNCSNYRQQMKKH